MSSLRPIASVHVDIAEFVLLVMEMDTEYRAQWVTDLARCLARRDPTLSEYGAKLLAEAEAYRYASSERGAKNARRRYNQAATQEAQSDATAGPNLQPHAVADNMLQTNATDSTDSTDSTDRNTPPSPNGDVPPKKAGNTYEIPDSLRKHPTFETWWQKWVDHRKQSRHPLTKTEAQIQLEDLSTDPDPIGTLWAAISGGCQRLKRVPPPTPATATAMGPQRTPGIQLPASYIPIDDAAKQAKNECEKRTQEEPMEVI